MPPVVAGFEEEEGQGHNTGDGEAVENHRGGDGGVLVGLEEEEREGR